MTTTPKGIQSSFADIRADYDATRHSRFVRRRTGVAAMGSGPDYHFRSESKYYDLIEQARDMDRNDALVGILADRRVDNIVQSGFTLDPKTGDKGLDNALWQWWEDFSNDPDQCDIAGECTWKEIERQACRSESIDGDIVVTGTEEGSYQLLESHLIRTKSKVDNTFLGVTTNRVGKREQYHVAEELSEFGSFGDSTPIDVRNADGIRQVFHVYNPNRVNPTRGVTLLAPIFSISGMLEDINFAKLVQQQVVSCFAIFRKLAAGQSGLPSVDGVYGEASTQQTDSGVRQIEGVSPGMEIVGQPGEELQGFSPNVPNSEYFQQVKLMLQIIGVNFGLPLCLVLMDGSETNFSGWRGAVDEARKGFVADQMNLVRRLNRPAYKWKLSQHLAETKDKALKTAYKDIGERIFQHNWNLPTWSYIEPVADAEGDATQLRNALTSPRRLHAARGKDWEEIAEESIADNAYAIERAAKQAAEINAQFPDSPMVNWRDLISLPMPQGVTVAMQDPAAIKAQEEGVKSTDAIDGEAVADPQINIAATALNGAQVTSLMDVVTQVGTGAMPKETASAVIAAAFPTLTPEQVAAILDPIKPGSISADGVPTAIDASGNPEQTEAGAEMVGVRRSDWKNSRKAINDILDELISQAISEQRARLELDSLGVPPAKIDLYIADAMDGKVDTSLEEVPTDVA